MTDKPSIEGLEAASEWINERDYSGSSQEIQGHALATIIDKYMQPLHDEIQQLSKDRFKESQRAKRAYAALKGIADYGKDQEGGYPDEICYDEFAYKRIVESYRKTAKQALAEGGNS